MYLGANIPIERLSLALDAVRPKLSVFLAQRLVSAANLFELAGYLAGQGAQLAFGGRIFVDAPALQSRIEGHYLGDELTGAIPIVERLLARQEPAPVAEPAPAEYEIALHYLEQRKPALDLAVAESLTAEGGSPSLFAVTGDFLTRSISAALRLGDLDLVAAELEWIGGLLGSREQGPSLLTTYLAAYHQALVATLDERGQPVINWFEAQAMQV